MKIDNLEILNGLIAGAEGGQLSSKKLPGSWSVEWKLFVPS